jgi:hypothetical protein
VATAITKRNVLAVEGEDEKNFFDRLMQDVSILDAQIECVGGKRQFKDKLPALLRTTNFFRADGSSFVENLAIIRDKDEDDAFKSIAGIVAKAGLTPPGKHGEFSNARPRVGIFIMPGQGVKGTMLEDLCLETVKDYEAMKCVQSFADCVQGLSDPPRNASKTKCQAFLAAQPEIVNSVGLGAQKGYWNLGSAILNELKTFLGQMK